MKELFHKPVLLNEVLSFVPSLEKGRLLDVTAGAAGHFSAILERNLSWTGECWDRDPDAPERIQKTLTQKNLQDRTLFRAKKFSESPARDDFYDFILADIGVSSFQLDDPERGMSLHSLQTPDFRMSPNEGEDFWTWLESQSEKELADILFYWGEEPKARKLARVMKTWAPLQFSTAQQMADEIARILAYPSPSRRHPATRAFQALRIAINDELGELKSLLRWAPEQLRPGGRLAIISFHSLEDRLVKNAFRDLAQVGPFDILSKKPIEAGPEELERNPRARSAKLRVIELR